MRLLNQVGILLFIFNTLCLKATLITVCDTISENTIWDVDTVFINCNIVVDSGATLTITPGTIVEFKNWVNYYNCGLIVYGSLIAEGTPNNRIKFIPEDTVYAAMNWGFGWAGIHFNGTKDQNGYSKLKYCDLSYTGIKFPKARRGNGAVLAENYNHLIVENCNIRENYCDIIYLIRFHDGLNPAYGAITVINSKTNILKNHITGTSGNGIVIIGNNESVVKNNYINNTLKLGRHSGYGIITVSDLAIIGNLITGNDRAIVIISNKEVRVKLINNTIACHTREGLYCEAGLAEIQLVNTVLWDAIASSYKQINLKACKSIDISYSFIEYGEEDITIEDTNTVVTWEESMDGNPDFADPDIGNFSLLPRSMAINSGTCDTAGLGIPKLDISGNPRIFEGSYHYRIDMGAFEYQADQEGIIPYVIHTEDQHMKLSDTLLLKVDFIDNDSDECHTISVFSDNENIEIRNLSGDTTGSTYKVISGETWQGIGKITVSVTDKYGYTDIDSFRVYVSEASCGGILEDEVWDEDTVKIYCDVIVEEGTTLKIRPGVVVEFQDYYEFNVQGRLLAIGTKDNPVKFTVHDTTGYHNFTHNGWNGIRFSNISDEIDSSKMVNCVVEYAINDVYPPEENGGGVKAINSNHILIDSCIFQYNYSKYGGAVYLYNSNIVISNCRIIRNRASTSGGGVYVIYSNSSKIMNCHITNNYAMHGGGIYFIYLANSTVVNCLIANNSVKKRGGGVYLYKSKDVFFTNNTICFNEAPTSSCGIHCSYDCFAHIINSIIYKNKCTNGIAHQVYIDESYPNAKASFENCDIEGGLNGIYGTHSGYFDNIDADPEFANPGLNDFSLAENSNCINKGTPDTSGLNLPLFDLAGNPRIFGDTVDIGAYEYFFKYHIPIDLVLSNTQVFEKTAAGTKVGMFTTQSDDSSDVFNLTFVNSDSIEDNDNNSFTILGDSLFINEIPDYETKDKYSIYVQTTYNGPGKSSITKAFTIYVKDLNEAPVVLDQAFSIDENSMGGTLVGIIKAIDKDKEQKLSYSILEGNINNAFWLDPYFGDLRANNSTALDFETNPEFDILICVSDNGAEPLADSALITIELIDVEEQTVIGTPAFNKPLIYPNPASYEVIIEFSDVISDKCIIELKSVTGSVLMSAKTTKNTAEKKIILDMSEFGNGLYFISFRNELFISTQKIEIIR